ncbi:unnamed protein product [Sphagnum troendelagicum]|uniref:Protein kinase domain-containing protein n=1 Tax=Sphagnum troendelagicum TaxID=128251 RepID=A0ABP0TIW4_9BRYO
MESKRDRELGALEKMFTNLLRGKRSIPSSVPQSAPLQQLPSGAAGRKPEVIEPTVLVGLHLGTTYSSFAYAHKSNPESTPSPIFTCHDWPGVKSKRDATPTAIYYKPQVGKANGDLCFRSWGYMAWTEFEKDLPAMLNLREQAATNENEAATNGNVLSSGKIPVVGSYVTPLRQHVSGSDAGPSSASNRPPGLTLNRVISDYLRGIGRSVWHHLQHVHFRSDLSMEDVQWCVTVPSIWSHNPRQQMKSCMADAGLVVGGSNGINASTHPVIMVLETDAASYWSCEKLSLQRGDKVLLAHIGYHTTDVVLKEWVGCEAAYNFKDFQDFMHSSSSLCGRIHVEKQYIEFLCKENGPLREYFLRFPQYKTRLLDECEELPDMCRRLMFFPFNWPATWQEYVNRDGLPYAGASNAIQLSNNDVENIVHPIVQANLDFIATQLSQTTGIRVMVVVGRLAGLSDLESRIRHSFGDRVGEIVFEEANEITISRGAVRIAQHCFPASGAKTFDLVVDAIDNVLIQTRQMDNQDRANNNCVRINQGQCNHLANKLAEMKDWLLQEHQNLDIILTWAMHRVLLHLLRVVKRADLLVRDCCKSEDWGKAAVLQAGNEEAFVGILHDLKWWCTHFLNLTILSGLNSSQQIQSLGDADKLNQFEPDHILARRAALDREELVANLMQFKRHDKSDVMVDHLLDRYSQQASDQSTKVHFPLPFWNTQDDKTLPIVKHLGHGAYGAVFESVWLRLPCAQKVFMGAENVSFKKEADILGTLKHPNIIQLFCCTMDAKSCSLVMELMSTDLRNLMDEKMKDPKHVVPFSLPVAVDIMLQVARGLKYMHEQRVGHRDIKSSNILVNPTSVPELAEMGYIDVKVADFGLAKAKLMSSTAAKQTKDIGTTPYRAPELYTQEEEIAMKNYPPNADVYSYGITCAEILTGKIPFPHTEYKRTELLQVIRQGERPPLPLDCPTPLANLITRCWDTDPCNRPGFLQVCNELLDFKRSNLMI